MTAQLIPALYYKDFTNNGLPLAFGFVYTYAAGTTLPIATYTDSTQTNQNTNPIILNSRGEASVWLNPTLSYKFVITDSAGNPIRTVDNVLGPLGPNQDVVPTVNNTYNLGSSTFTWANGYFGTNLYINGVAAYQLSGNIIGSTGITAAETAAGVTVYNFGYPPGLVDRYILGGNATPGTTDCTIGWNAALAQGMQIGGAEVTFFQTTTYLVTSALNGTFTGSGNQTGLKIRGLGGPSLDAGHAILANHTQVAVFDFTGNDGVVMEDVVIHTNASTFPQVGILMAKNAANTGDYGRFRNVKCNGYFSVACYYNYRCEDDSMESCVWSNSSTGVGTKTRVYTSSNTLFALTSPYTTIATGSGSTTDHWSSASYDFNIAATSTSDCVYVEGTCNGIHNFCGYAFSSGGRALFYFDTTATTSDNCQIIGVKGDASGADTQLFGVLISSSGSSQVMAGLVVSDCYFPNVTYAIQSGTNVTLSSCTFRNIAESSASPSAHGINIIDIIEDSLLETNQTVLNIGTSANNAVIGDSGQWTIASRINDYWLDTGTSNKTFSPGIVTATHGWTIVGTLTQSGKLLYSGNIAEFTILVSGSTSIAWTNAATITLPFTATVIGTASVTDYTAGTTVGPAKISGNTLTMANAQSASSDQFMITGRAFIA